MDILQILRRHLDESPSPELEAFSSILGTIEQQFTGKTDESNHHLYIARCIDLEGLDGCGKSTLAEELHRQLTARGQKSRLLSTPPSQLLPFRPYFDAQAESVRRAYYNLGNIIVSLDLKTQPDSMCILDRYWPSTFAYKQAKANNNNNNEPKISWPKYLVQPALIAYIYVDEEERCRRIAQRSIPVTLEEKQLAAQEEFRRRLDSIYRNNIPSSRLHVIDGNRPTNIIANDILDLIAHV